MGTEREDDGLPTAVLGETVFILQHLYIHAEGGEDVKLIGAYRSAEAAHSAIERLREQPGFRDCPHFIDPSLTDEEAGFYIDKYRLDEDHWEVGFITVRPERCRPRQAKVSLI